MCNEHSGQNSNVIAELVFGMFLYLARNGFDGTAVTELKNSEGLYDKSEIVSWHIFEVLL
ncbi:MAG: hypothetical protein GX921_10255 [Bacteroidales bacterium]|nr:hypothetical protein [Bacteroidales bacterium]